MGSSYAKQWLPPEPPTHTHTHSTPAPNLICTSILLTSDSLMTLEGFRVITPPPSLNLIMAILAILEMLLALMLCSSSRLVGLRFSSSSHELLQNVITG